jgi:hypothetical protein
MEPKVSPVDIIIVVCQEGPRRHEAEQVGGEHRLGPGRGRQGTQSEEDQEDELHLGLAHRVSERPDDGAETARQDEKGEHGGDSERDQQGVVLAKTIPSASTVPRSHTKQAVRMSLPRSVRLRPVSTITASTTATEVVESAMPAIWLACSRQWRTNRANAQAPAKGAAKPTPPMARLGARKRRRDSGSISAPARKVSRTLPKPARKSIHSFRRHAQEISAHHADENLDKCDRQPSADGDDAREHGQPHPEGGDTVRGVQAGEDAHMERAAGHRRTPTRNW